MCSRVEEKYPMDYCPVQRMYHWRCWEHSDQNYTEMKQFENAKTQSYSWSWFVVKFIGAWSNNEPDIHIVQLTSAWPSRVTGVVRPFEKKNDGMMI